MFDIGSWELIIIAVVTLLVVGPDRLPELAKKAGYYFAKLRNFISYAKSKVEDEIQNSTVQLEEEKNSILNIIEDGNNKKSAANKIKVDKNDNKKDD